MLMETEADLALAVRSQRVGMVVFQCVTSPSHLAALIMVWGLKTQTHLVLKGHYYIIQAVFELNEGGEFLTAGRTTLRPHSLIMCQEKDSGSTFAEF